MWPFGQIWLPDAHPAAPSPVSALLSGVMIKTGVYGLMRSFIWLIPGSALASYPSQIWGLVIALLGTITLFIGTMQALKQEQTKRLLAFHSIGQVGYILLGIGCCLALIGPGWSSMQILGLAALGYYGALFHTINHALFKSLLFFNAGSILSATGTQNLNHLGGLIKYMKITALTTLVASFSIAGVPLFNGFTSKWTIYVSAILGSPSAKYLAICAVVAILTSALTLASFIKFFGISFLSRTSKLVETKAAEKTSLEVSWEMLLPQVILAVICIGFGIFPMIAYGVIGSALQSSHQGLASMIIEGSGGITSTMLGISASGSRAILAPFIMGLILIAMVLAAQIISRLAGSESRAADPWLCGYASQSDANRYKAHGLYIELKRYFGWVGGKPKV
jgi:formate hydrogenlyase subunit 3/multisubunit Na+/H+ antiporter MnhD subunit